MEKIEVKMVKKKKKNNKKVDRISTLPDSLIHYIFSFMDMKLVVQTCVLSKRWKSLWLSTPYLSFDIVDGDDDYDYRYDSVRYYQKMDNLISFVDRVMFLRDSCRIIKFKISSKSYLLLTRVYSWVITALKHHVEEICLEFPRHSIDACSELPYNLFTSGIKRFMLKNTCPSYDTHRYSPMPMSMCTSKNIKTLCLQRIILPKGNSDGELILSCPVLEDLIMKYFDDEHLKRFTISAPRLQKLNLLARNYSAVPTCTIMICSPNITSLKCDGYISSPWLLKNLSVLHNAHISVWGDRHDGLSMTERNRNTDKELYALYLFQILEGVSNVTVLTISTTVLKALPNCGDIFQKLPNLFHNVRDFILDNFREGDQAPTFAITNFLSRLPCIRTFVWKVYKYQQHHVDSTETDYEGAENELEFVKLIFERVVALKKVDIVTQVYTYKGSLDKKEIVSSSTSIFKRHKVLLARRRRLKK